VPGSWKDSSPSTMAPVAHASLARRQVEAVRESGTPVVVGGSGSDPAGRSARHAGAEETYVVFSAASHWSTIVTDAISCAEVVPRHRGARERTGLPLHVSLREALQGLSVATRLLPAVEPVKTGRLRSLGEQHAEAVLVEDRHVERDGLVVLRPR
jgi:hypothetical protein